MQKGKYYDRLFLHWLGGCLAVCATVLALMLVSGTAHADIPPPPPPSYHQPYYSGRTPVEEAMHRQGYSFERKTMGNDRGFYNYYSGSGSNHYNKNGGVITKTNVGIRGVDNYGATARGTVNTTTQLPPTSRMAQGLGGLIVADIATNHLATLQNNGASDQFVRGMENGDWVEVAGAVGKLFDWTGIGARLNGNLNDGALISPLHAQSLADARQLYDEYQASNQIVPPSDYNKYDIVTINQSHPSNLDRSERTIIIPKTAKDGVTGWYISRRDGNTFNFATGFTYTFPEGNEFVSIFRAPATKAAIEAHNKGAAPTIDQVLPAETAIINLLTQLLNDTNRNNTDLINAIWGSGVANAGNTTTTVDSNQATNNTFLTSAYTPAGSNTPQQTQFKVNQDGSVTATQIPRPDLAPHSSQAPTRAEIPTAPVSGNTTPTNPTDTKPTEPATASQPNICAQNPDAAMCAELGNVDYEDPVIPEQQLRLNFNPESIFGTDGQCPQPKRISLMSTEHEFSYQPTCDFARGVRPMLIALGMVLAMGMAYSAAKEL